MLWQFLKNSSFTKVMMSIVSATLPGVETLIKNFHFVGNNFPTRSQTKSSPTKAVTYPRHFFIDREVKKIKCSWDKIAHQG